MNCHNHKLKKIPTKKTEVSLTILWLLYSEGMIYGFSYFISALMLLTDNGNQSSKAGIEYSVIITLDANLTSTMHQTVFILQ